MGRRGGRPTGTTWWSLVASLAVFVSFGCTSGNDGAPSGDGITAPIDTSSEEPAEEPSPSSADEATANDLDVDDAIALLDAIDDPLVAETSDDRLGDQLFEHREDPAVLATALVRLEQGSERWVDVYVWANGGLDPEPLRRFLTHTDPVLRLMAAAGVLSMGGIDGFAPLVDALVDDSLFGTPPLPVWHFAVTTLTRLAPTAGFGPPYDASPAQRAAARDRWQAWVASIGPEAFSVESGLWGAA